MFEVIYPICSLDSNPTMKMFDTEHEAFEWVTDEVAARVEHIVAHSTHVLSDEDVADIEQSEWALVCFNDIGRLVV